MGDSVSLSRHAVVSNFCRFMFDFDGKFKENEFQHISVFENLEIKCLISSKNRTFANVYFVFDEKIGEASFFNLLYVSRAYPASFHNFRENAKKLSSIFS